jgi:hypothetical protein
MEYTASPFVRCGRWAENLLLALTRKGFRSRSSPCVLGCFAAPRLRYDVSSIPARFQRRLLEQIRAMWNMEPLKPPLEMCGYQQMSAAETGEETHGLASKAPKLATKVSDSCIAMGSQGSGCTPAEPYHLSAPSLDTHSEVCKPAQTESIASLPYFRHGFRPVSK